MSLLTAEGVLWVAFAILVIESGCFLILAINCIFDALKKWSISLGSTKVKIAQRFLIGSPLSAARMTSLVLAKKSLTEPVFTFIILTDLLTDFVFFDFFM